MTPPDQSRCPDAYTSLAFAVGCVVGLAWVGRSVLYAARIHRFERP